MTEKELFDMIDRGIDVFKMNEGHQKRIRVNNRTHSDWLNFKWRQLTWNENDLNYLIEVYPEFNEQEKIESWNLQTAVYYDRGGKRYYLNHKTADKQTLEFIADKIIELFSSSYKWITTIRKEEIPPTELLKRL